MVAHFYHSNILKILLGFVFLYCILKAHIHTNILGLILDVNLIESMWTVRNTSSTGDFSVAGVYSVLVFLILLVFLVIPVVTFLTPLA